MQTLKVAVPASPEKWERLADYTVLKAQTE